MDANTMFCRGFEDGLCEKECISRIDAYERLPIEWHEFVDDYLNGHDDGIARDWFRYNQLDKIVVTA